MASEPILRICGISLRKGRAILLDSVSFALERGRFYGLLGPNGAGKSSLLKILYRAETASAGAIELEGRPVAALGGGPMRRASAPWSRKKCRFRA